MNFWKRLHAERKKSDLDDEIAAHLAMAAADKCEQGADPDTAQQQARREFGNAALIKDVTREAEGWLWLERILQDLRYALRQMRKSPGFAIAAILTLALGIGAATLVFSIFYAGIINPCPYKDAAGILQMGFMGKRGMRGVMSVSTQDLHTVRQASTVQDAMLTGFSDPITTISGYPEDVEIAAFSGNGFRFLGVAPLFGRALTAQDQYQRVVVLGYDFCRDHFACNQNILGRALDLNHRPYTIVGVMPPRFAWEDTSAYIPLRPSKSPDDVFSLYLRAKPGVSPEELSAQMRSLVQQFVFASEGVKLTDDETKLRSFSYADQTNNARGLKLLLAAVFGLLLIACGNVSILMLGRARVRQQEFAMRMALGASRARLIRQLLTEACFLSLLGGATGIACAYAGMDLLRVPLLRSFFTFSPAETALAINTWVLCFSTLISVASGFLAGISPALEIAAASRTHQLADRHNHASAHRRSRRFLIAIQVALSLLLLVGAGSAVQSFLRLYRLDLGFDPHHVLKFRLPVPEGEFQSWTSRVDYYTALRHRLQAVPGVKVASVDWAMATGGGFQGEYSLPDEHFGADMDIKMPRADLEFIDAQFFSTFRIPVLVGRNFTQAEFDQGVPVALINRGFARRLFGAVSPIGRRLRVPALVAGYPGALRPEHPSEFVQIIGVTGDVKSAWVSGAPARQTIYLPESLFATANSLRVQLRTAGDPYAVLADARRAVQQVSPDQPISQVRAYEEILSQDLWSHDRWLSILLGTFSSMALFLFATGIYSVAAFSVAQRNREFGVRLALGADRWHITKIVLLSEFGAICAGILVGIIGGIVLERFYRSFLGSTTQNLFLLPAGCALVLAIGLLASYLPSRRASHLEPADILRAE